MVKQRILHAIFWLSCLYVALVVLGAVLAQFLPSEGGPEFARESMCFWHNDDWFRIVKCGDQVFAHFALEIFFNFLFYGLFLFSVSLTLHPSVWRILTVAIFYAPIVFLLWCLFKTVRKKWRKKRP